MTAFAPAAVEALRRADGSILLMSPQGLLPFPPTTGHLLRRWAAEAPERPFLSEREGGAWRTLSYAEALTAARKIARALIDQDIKGPIAILSGNSIRHALLALAAQLVGIPFAPLSPAYSLLSKDFQRLKAVHSLIEPDAAFVEERAPFEKALAASGSELRVILGRGSGPLVLDALIGGEGGGEELEQEGSVGLDSVVKLLLTSGSTGEPKAVINSQRMLCSNQQAIAQLWPFLELRPPVLLDWLPWSHTFGGNHNFNLVLRHGGHLHIDAGKPAPGLLAPTLEGLRELSPTLSFNVPKGFSLLLPHLEEDDALAASYFRELELIFYAGAALPQPLWERLESLSLKHRGEKIPLVSAWGSTETAPMATAVHFPIPRAGVIGLPAPGTAIKLAPMDGRFELRVRGPNVTPGYWRREAGAAFDEEGFYRTGDAGRFLDPRSPERGLVFGGRLAEDFKLSSGTWVRVGALRLKAIAALAPIAQDLIIAGRDRGEVAVLIVADPAGCRSLIDGEVDDEGLAEHPAVLAELARLLALHNARVSGESARIGRALILKEPLSFDGGEITDKGAINQARALELRSELIEELYAGAGVRAAPQSSL